MSKNNSQALVPVESQVAIRNAAGFWAENPPRAETYDRKDRLQDKIGAVTRCFSFMRKHSGETTPADVER